MLTFMVETDTVADDGKESSSGIAGPVMSVALPDQMAIRTSAACQIVCPLVFKS